MNQFKELEKGARTYSIARSLARRAPEVRLRSVLVPLFLMHWITASELNELIRFPRPLRACLFADRRCTKREATAECLVAAYLSKRGALLLSFAQDVHCTHAVRVRSRSLLVIAS